MYDRNAAIHAADEHAAHFLHSRIEQFNKIGAIMDRPPIVLAPYDAELFGHWWYEGPEFLDYFVRKAYYDQKVFSLITPHEYLGRHPTQQIARPSASLQFLIFAFATGHSCGFASELVRGRWIVRGKRYPTIAAHFLSAATRFCEAV